MAASEMDFSCPLCMNLTTGDSHEAWSIENSRLRPRVDNCQTCTFIYDAISSCLAPVFLDVFTFVLFDKRDKEDKGPLRITLYGGQVNGGHGGALTQRLQVFTAEKSNSNFPWPKVGISQHIKSQTLNETNLRMMNKWLDDCTHRHEGHKLCATLESPGELPTRLIDVGQNQDDPIRLHISTAGEKSRYAALSHCWGGSAPLQTTKDTFLSFMDCIPEPLPNTFADAITTTRALGMRYLWIDSLCIIQDDEIDWLEEAPRMADVYGNAYVSISADAAKNCNDGFLDHSKRELGLSTRVKTKVLPENTEVWVRRRAGLAKDLPYHDWLEPDLPNPRSGQGFRLQDLRAVMDMTSKATRPTQSPVSKLSTRGWVFQERVLAPRTLYFGEAEIGWECYSKISCECSETSMRYRRRHSSMVKKANRDMDWEEVVEHFTNLNLTFQKDRLLALSGLAKQRHSRIGDLHHSDDYAAGMWQSSLKRDLQWCRKLDPPSVNRFSLKPVESPLNEYIAPSWSWASVPRKIEYPTRNPETDYVELFSYWEILEVNCQNMSTASFGNCIPGSHLIIRGYLAPVKYVDQWGANRVKTKTLRPLDDLGTRREAVIFRWDSDARQDAVKLSERQLMFFIMNKEPNPPEGILLQSCEPEADLRNNTYWKSSEIIGLQSYKRIATVSMAQLVKRRVSRNWSDDDTSSSEEYYEPDGESWPYWWRFAKKTTFAWF